MKKNSKVLISTYGSTTLGVGHIVRDRALANTLTPDMDVTFHVDERHSPCGASLLGTAGFGTIIQGTLREAVLKTQPDVVIYDRPTSLGKIENLQDFTLAGIVALDYFNYDDEQVTAFVNIKNHSLNSVSTGRSSHTYEGMSYAIIRDDILKHKNTTPPSDKAAERVLVTFGGADPAGHTKIVLTFLAGLSGRALDIRVVVGLLFQGSEADLGDGFPHRVTFLRDRTDLGEHMVWADLAFCGAGVTLMELLYLGCPSVVIPQNNDELDLATKLKSGGIVLVFTSDELRKEAQIRTIHNLIRDPKQLQVMRQRGQHCVDGRGRERIKKIIQQTVSSG
jgi:spore coat polysaccharide biosynthesis predicted glycosyltransferase SpsG